MSSPWRVYVNKNSPRVRLARLVLRLFGSPGTSRARKQKLETFSFPMFSSELRPREKMRKVLTQDLA